MGQQTGAASVGGQPPSTGSHPTFWLWVQIPSVKIDRYRCSFIPAAFPLLSAGRDGWVVVLLLFDDADDVKNDAAVYDLPFFTLLLANDFHSLC